MTTTDLVRRADVLAALDEVLARYSYTVLNSHDREDFRNAIRGVVEQPAIAPDDDDDELTPEEAAAMERGRADFAAGRTTTLEQIAATE